MIIVNINRNILKFIVIMISIVLVASLSFNIFCYKRNAELSKKYRSIVNIINQSGSKSLVSFVASTDVQLHAHKNIEIFDVEKGEVIKQMESNPVIREEAKKYLKAISGMYVKVKALPDRGYIIRLHLEPPSEVQNQWLNDYNINSVDEVFIIFPDQEKPYLLVMDDKKRPLFYNFSSNTDILLKELDFHPNVMQ